MQMRHEDRRTLMSRSPDDGEAVASRRGEERGGDASLGLMEQGTEDRQRIQMALRTGPKQRREHLLGVSTAPRAISATDLAQHESGADARRRPPGCDPHPPDWPEPVGLGHTGRVPLPDSPRPPHAPPK